MSPKKAIVIPFNPHLDFWGGSAIGSLIAHKMFADQHGAVYWDLARACSHSDINVAYFYDSSLRAVTFKAKVDLIEPKENINVKEEKYVPNWRKINWEMKQTPGQVWLKLRDIFPLKRKHKLTDFRKVSDGKRLKRVQNFAIVKDPGFKEEKKQFLLNQFIDDYVYRLVSKRDGKLLETDIEEILRFLMMSRNLQFVERQKGKDNRIDVAFKDHKNRFIVVEIKKGTAGLNALTQIKRYMKEIRTTRRATQISGIILCRKPDMRLLEALKNEKYISIDEYKFSLNFPKIERQLR